MKKIIFIVLLLAMCQVSWAAAGNKTTTANNNNVIPTSTSGTDYLAFERNVPPVVPKRSGILLGARLGIVSQVAPKGSSVEHEIVSSIFPIGTQIYAGYQFNRNIAVTVGYYSFYNNSENTNTDMGPDHYRLNGGDLAVKLMQPILSHFNVFLRPGVAVIHEDVYNLQLVTDTKPLVDINVTKALPELGAGVSFEMFNHFGCDLMYNYILGSGDINSISFFALGIYARA